MVKCAMVGQNMKPIMHLHTTRRWGLLFLGCVLLILFASACGREERELVVQLVEIDGSAQSGTATLTALGDQTQIVILVNPGPPDNDPQPLHVHFGACGPRLGAVAHVLENMSAGVSTTTLDATLASLRDGNRAINLHLSVPGIRTYTACGNIPEQ